MSKYVLSLLFLLLWSVSLANDLHGKVIAVIDGNTVKIECPDAEIHTVQLFGIDSPELNQEFGQESRKFLEKVILGKKVNVSFRGKDRLGNPLAEVIINGKNDPRIMLLKEGLAWTAEKNPIGDLEVIRSLAQQKGKGLWKQESPTPPWIYRREQTMLQPKSS